MHYYSESTGGFYDTTIHTTWPEDVVEITAEYHATLLAGQAQGKTIMPGKDGKPLLTVPAPSHLHRWNGKEWTLDKAAASQLLIGGALAVVGHSVETGQPHNWTEVIFNVAVAGYFLVRSRRIHLLDGLLSRKSKLPLSQRSN